MKKFLIAVFAVLIAMPGFAVEPSEVCEIGQGVSTGEQSAYDLAMFECRNRAAGTLNANRISVRTSDIKTQYNKSEGKYKRVVCCNATFDPVGECKFDNESNPTACVNSATKTQSRLSDPIKQIKVATPPPPAPEDKPVEIPVAAAAPKIALERRGALSAPAMPGESAVQTKKEENKDIMGNIPEQKAKEQAAIAAATGTAAISGKKQDEKSVSKSDVNNDAAIVKLAESKLDGKICINSTTSDSIMCCSGNTIDPEYDSDRVIEHSIDERYDSKICTENGWVEDQAEAAYNATAAANRNVAARGRGSNNMQPSTAPTESTASAAKAPCDNLSGQGAAACVAAIDATINLINSNKGGKCFQQTGAAPNHWHCCDVGGDANRPAAQDGSVSMYAYDTGDSSNYSLVGACPAGQKSYCDGDVWTRCTDKTYADFKAAGDTSDNDDCIYDDASGYTFCCNTTIDGGGSNVVHYSNNQCAGCTSAHDGTLDSKFKAGLFGCKTGHALWCQTGLTGDSWTGCLGTSPDNIKTSIDGFNKAVDAKAKELEKTPDVDKEKILKDDFGPVITLWEKWGVEIPQQYQKYKG